MGKFHSKQGEYLVCKVDVKLALHKSWHVFQFSCKIPKLQSERISANKTLFSLPIPDIVQNQ